MMGRAFIDYSSHMLDQMILLYFNLYLMFSSSTVENTEIADNVVWRSERACGLNSLYFLLTLTGHKADYLQLQQSLLKERLVSLEDMRNTAKSHGMPVRIVTMSPSELRSLTVPVVAHFETVEVSGKAGGHFVVVFDTDDEGVHYVDGTTAETFHVSWRKFERSWSGYIVCPYESKVTNWLLSFSSFLVGAIAGFFFMRRSKHKSNTQLNS